MFSLLSASVIKHVQQVKVICELQRKHLDGNDVIENVERAQPT